MADEANGITPDHIEFRFLAEGRAVQQVLRGAVASFSRHMSGDDVGTLELILAEVLNNVVEHAYANLPPGLVTLSLWRHDGSLVCEVEDGGMPMPGLRLPDGQPQPVPKDIQDFAEGGWGWVLIRALTTDLRYARLRDANHLSFRVPLGADRDRRRWGVSNA